MRYQELIETKTTTDQFMAIMKDFLPLAMKELQLTDLPEFKLMKHIPDKDQPTFGRYVNHENRIYLGLNHRHPLDIIRTLAHELVHYKQNTEHQLDDTAGHTGSPQENEAHEIAGIIMRHFNKKHPEYFKDHAVDLDEGVAEGSLEELANTSLKVKEPKDMYNVNDRKQTTYKIFKFKSGKKTFLINFTVKSPPTYGKKQNWNAVIVSFGVKEKQDDYSFGDEMNTDLTGKNKNQFLIYSTVINTIRRFITEYNTEIDEIIMQGAGERQEAMYQRFFQSAPKYFPGWHYDGKHSLVRDVPRPTGKKVREQGVGENFADGRNPGRKGLAKRSGVNTKASVSSLRNTAKHSTGEKARMAHWLANMKAGKAKKKH